MGLRPDRYEVDGALGWLAVLGAFLTNVVYGSSTRAFGVLYLMLRQNFPRSELAVSGVGALNLVVIGLGGLPSAWLCKRASYRLVALLGAVVTVGSFLLAARAQQLQMLYLWYGVINGVGMSLVYTCSFLVVDGHFEKFKVIAMSLAVGGSGVGAFIFPPIFETIRHRSDEACFLCLGGLASLLLLNVVLYRKPGEAFLTDLGFGNCCGAICNRAGGNRDPLLTPRHSDEPSLVDYESLDVREGNGVPGGGDRHVSPGLTTPGKSTGSDETGPKEHSEAAGKDSAFCDWKQLCSAGITVLLLQNVSVQAFTAFDSMYTPAFAIDQGISHVRASWLLSSTGISGIVIPLLISVIVDNSCCQLNLLVAVNMAAGLGASLQIVFPASANFVVLVVLCSLKSGLVSSFLTQRATLAGRVGGVRNLGAVLGLSLVAEAMGSLIGRTAGGAFKDFYGHYHYGYYLTGSLLLMTSLFFQAVFCETQSQFAKDEKGT